MNVGDLVSVDIDGEKLCLITGFCLPAGGDYEMVELFCFTGKEKHWSTASYRVRLINEAG
tara:strand:+ start:1749 stop:1928 length:180 start_codon:yes stop_codon:yes gene_type:complete